MKVMARRDARSLDHATLEEMRRLAVKAVLDGDAMTEVAARFEVNYKTVSRWVCEYRRGGDEALASSKAEGPTPKLSPAQVRRLKKIIVGKDPRQLNFGSALWTLPLVGQLIEQVFDVVLDHSNVWRLLKKLGLSPQKPARRAFLRDEEECRAWMVESFPAVVREAQRKQAVLLFLDESAIHEDQALGRTWGERGKTPIVETSGTRRRISVISAISPRGRMWFRCFRGTLNAARYVEFLKGLLFDLKKPIVLVHDRHPAHRAAATRRFIADNRSRLSVHELPRYAPELNPDEHVWSYLKGTFSRSPIDFDDHFDVRVVGALDAVKRDKALVKSFFGHPEVAYVRRALKWESA